MTSNVPEITAKEVADIVQESGVIWFSHHSCSICGYRCAYIIDGPVVQYDAGCYCVPGAPRIEQRSFEHLAAYHNMQDGEFEGVSWRQRIRDALAGTPSDPLSVGTKDLTA